MLSLIARLEQANLLEMAETDFQRLMAEIEKSPLFQTLHREQRVIRYARVPGTDIASGFHQPVRPEIIADKGSLDIDSLIANKDYLVRRIQKLGLENFKRYFLYPEPDIGVQEIAQECDLEMDEVMKILDLMDEFSIHSEFYHPSTGSPEQQLHYAKVASVERGAEGFVVGYFSPALARGKYDIDYERFEQLRQDGALSHVEARNARRMLKKLELINIRKDTVGQILRSIVDKQTLYFESGEAKALLPFSQKALAEKLELAPSSISRAISSKSLDTPWGEEKPLKYFFPRPSKFQKKLVRQLLEEETEPLSDEAIKKRLEKEFGVSISRRSVARFRNELKMPASWQRTKRFTRGLEED